MKEFTYTITDPVGIHARPAGLLVKAIKALDSTVTIEKEGGQSASGSKLMALMSLGIKQGDRVIVRLEGDSEETDAAALEQFFHQHL